MISIDQLKRLVQEVPPLPDIVVRLVAMCHDSSVAPREIVEVIKYDPSTTTKVLRLCNSPYFGLSRQVTSLQEAMVYIGTDALVNFVLAGCLSSYYREDNEGYGLTQGELWRHSVGAAICSQHVADLVDPELSGRAFTCGLLHDVGKMILNACVAEEFGNMLRMVEQDGKSFLDAEQERIGYTHPEAGAHIAEHWNLPAEIVDVLRYHHDPLMSEEHKRLVSVVHIGNILCISFGIGIGSDGLAYRFHPGALQLLGLKVQSLFELAVDIHDSYKKAEDLLALG